MPARRRGPWLSLPAASAGALAPVCSVEVAWVAQASRGAAGLGVCHSSTSYQATIRVMAYGGHGKVTVGRSEGAASADRGLVPSDGTRGGKGLITCLLSETVSPMVKKT